MENLRVLALLGDFEDMDRMNVERILDNTNKKAALELERLYKAREKAEKESLALEKRIEKERLKEAKAQERESLALAKRLEKERIREEKRIARQARLRELVDREHFERRVRNERDRILVLVYQEELELQRFGIVGRQVSYIEVTEIARQLIRSRQIGTDIPNRDLERLAVVANYRRTGVINVDNTSRSEKIDSKPKDGVKDCPVCYDNTMCILNYNCKHSFCKDCLEKWTRVCPICRSI